MYRYMHIRSIVTAILATALVSVAASAAFGQDDGGGPGDWLANYRSATSIGMGGASVALSTGPLDIVWNPAALSNLYQNEVQAETAFLFEGTSINSLSFGVPSQRLPSVAATMIALRSGTFEQRDALNQPLGEFREGDTAFFLTASKGITPRLSVGANLKIIHQSIEDFTATGVGADLGVTYDVTPAVRIGASMLNVGGPGLTLRAVEETFPSEYRGGVLLRLMNGRTRVSAELDYREDIGTQFFAGTEFWIVPSVGMRLGYDGEFATGGFSYRVTPNLRIDHGMINHELGITHRFGISYTFGGFFASSRAVPEVFSPIGERSVTQFHLNARTKGETESWRLDIRDKQDEVVRSFGGSGTPPSHVMWDGKNEAGLPLPDGSYQYRLVVVDSEGREILGPRGDVKISTEGPKGAVPVIIGE